MKSLWKYLSALGLMFVAFLCVGIGFKSDEKADAADTCIYVAKNGKYTMSDGIIGSYNKVGVYVEQGATFIMNGGTISNYHASGIDGSSGSITINNGSVRSENSPAVSPRNCNFTINGGTITGSGSQRAISCMSATININGGTITGGISLGGGFVTYNGGTVDEIQASNGDSGALITFRKNPTSTITINKTFGTSSVLSVGNKIAKLDGISTLTLSRIKCPNLPDNLELQIQTISNEKWIVVAEKTCTLTIKAGYYNLGQSETNVTWFTTATSSGFMLSDYGSGTVIDKGSLSGSVTVPYGTIAYYHTYMGGPGLEFKSGNNNLSMRPFYYGSKLPVDHCTYKYWRFTGPQTNSDLTSSDTYNSGRGITIKEDLVVGAIYSRDNAFIAEVEEEEEETQVDAKKDSVFDIRKVQPIILKKKYEFK